jgi:hypothetical protein
LVRASYLKAVEANLHVVEARYPFDHYGGANLLRYPNPHPRRHDRSGQSAFAREAFVLSYHLKYVFDARHYRSDHHTAGVGLFGGIQDHSQFVSGSLANGSSENCLSLIHHVEPFPAASGTASELLFGKRPKVGRSTRSLDPRRSRRSPCYLRSIYDHCLMGRGNLTAFGADLRKLSSV